MSTTILIKNSISSSRSMPPANMSGMTGTLHIGTKQVAPKENTTKKMIDGAAQRDERRRPSFVPDVKDPRCVIFGAPSESSFSDHVIEFYNIFGWQAGMIVLTYSAHGDRVKRFAAWAAVTGLLGLALCGASLDDGPIPVNKNLWSLSYVFATTATAFALMGRVIQ